MDLKTYFLTLNEKEKIAYCNRANTSVGYIRSHLIPVKGDPDRVPRPDLMKALAKASNGKVNYSDVLQHFYKVSEAA